MAMVLTKSCVVHGQCIVIEPLKTDLNSTSKSRICSRHLFQKGPTVSSFWNVKTLSDRDGLEKAREALVLMEPGSPSHFDTCLCLLQICNKAKFLPIGKQVHAHIIRRRVKLNIFLNNNLINMYAKCGSIEDACQVFQVMHALNVITWTTIITSYAQERHGAGALVLFKNMQQEGVKSDKVTFVSILNACALIVSFDQGKQIHANVLRSGCGSDISVFNALVSLYVKCGRIKDARKIFDRTPTRDLVSWSAMITGYVQDEDSNEAVMLYEQIQQEGIQPDKTIFISLLCACTSDIGLAEQGRRVHSHVLRADLQGDVFVGSSLINMYVKHGRIQNAFLAFSTLPIKNVVSWNAMISGYGQIEDGFSGLELFRQMQQEEIQPSKTTFVNVLSTCTSCLAIGRWVHALILRGAHETDAFVASSIIDMYGKLGSIGNARDIFDRMHTLGVVLWNTMITAYVHQGDGKEAFKLFARLEQVGPKANEVTFVAALSACASMLALHLGKKVHASVMYSKCGSHNIVMNSLIDMYAKCDIEGCFFIFVTMHTPDLISWNAMISGYARKGQNTVVLHLLERMQQEGMQPNESTYVNILSVVKSWALDQGKYIHARILRSGLEQDILVTNILVDMYGKSGSMEDAYHVFNVMAVHDVISWNSMITGYSYGNRKDALCFFWQMHESSVKPNEITLISVLSTCANEACLEAGKQIHAAILGTEHAEGAPIIGSIIDMYVKCGDSRTAHELFDGMPVRDLYLWGIIISAYMKQGNSKEALNLLEHMQQVGAMPIVIDFVGMLNACGVARDLRLGKLLHEEIVKAGCELDIFVSSALVEMYAKCGSIGEARQLFDRMPVRDAISWNGIIAGYVQHGEGKEALDLFRLMEEQDVKPDKFTCTTVLNASANLSALEEGVRIHALVLEVGFETDMFVASSLIDMYAKCGCIQKARLIFDNMIASDIIAWNVMISAYSQHGMAKDALKLFHKMHVKGVRATAVTFISILFACSHAYFLDQGCQYFHSLCGDHAILPICEHYACIVDILGRAGYLDEAMDFLKAMPYQPKTSIYMSFLGASRLHKLGAS